jgi:membrane protease YdiL (CAAX protease family)
MRWYSPFWNSEERRLRAGWRLLAVVVLFVILNLLVAGVAFLAEPVLGRIGVGPDALSAPLLGVIGPVQLVGTLAMLGVLALLVDRRRVGDFGLRVDREWTLDLGFGLFLGGALQSAVFALEYALGWVRVTGFVVTDDPSASFALWFGAAVVGYLCVGIYEELFARGVLLTNVAEGLDGLWRIGPAGAVAVAVLASSAVFGALHAANPGATLVSTVMLVVAGVFLAVGYVLTGELAIPIGVHITWNFFQGVVWGFPVSGASLGVSLVGLEQAGPRLFTGGAFGPEAGLLGLFAMLVGIAATAWWVRARGGDLAIAPGLTTPDLRWEKE